MAKKSASSNFGFDFPAGEFAPGTVVLVRPDGTVAWRDNSVPADPLKVVDAVRGAA